MFPAETPEKFRLVTELGNPVAVNALRGWRLWVRVAVTLLLLAAAASTPFLAQANVADGGSNWYWVGGAALFFAVLLGILTWKRLRSTIVTFDDGIAWEEGDGVRTLRWDQVTAVAASRTRHSINFIPTGSTYRYTVDMDTGEPKVLTTYNTAHVESVGEHIIEKVMPRIFEECVEAFDRGEEVQFGPVVIGRDLGIKYKQKVFPWEEIGAIDVDAGTFICTRAGGGWGRGVAISIGDIPNFEALYGILTSLMAPEEEQEPS